VLSRRYLIVLLVALALGRVDAARASEPFMTEMPTLDQSTGALVLNNGGWMSYSGAVDRYVFRFTRDGSLVKGPLAVAKTSPPDRRLPGEYPADPQANVYRLRPADAGRTICGEVWAGTHSIHYYANGGLAYDLIEWGHAAPNGALARVCVAVGGTPQAPAPPLTVGPAGLARAAAGVAYAERLVVSGGVAPYTVALADGFLPHGLVLGSDGTLTGTPRDRAGLFRFTLLAMDANGTTGTAGFTLTLQTAVLELSRTLPAARVGRRYRARVQARGGTAPYRFGLVAGRLPRGLVLSRAGVLSGIPRRAGLYAFRIRVTDALGATGERLYRLTIR
jgi:Putative Ig domain